MNVSKISAAGILAAALSLAATASAQDMTFFITSVGKGKGADLGGLEGADAHCNALAKQTALSEKGDPIKARGDTPNEHDILTGSDPQGRFSTAAGDTTCGNWTKSGDGSAIVGHHDRAGLKDTWHMKSWNSSHGSRGCSQDQLKASGGAGLFYCFVPN